MAHYSTTVRSALILACLVLASIFALPCKALQRGKHYEVVQLNDNIKQVLFDASSLRINCKNSTVIVSHAPQWDVCIFNTASKRIYRTTEAKFKIRWVSFPSTPMPVMPLLPKQQIKNYVRDGWKETTMVAAVHEEKIDANEVFFASHAAHKNLVFDQYTYTVREGDFPPAVCHILQDLYRVPVDSRFPLYFLRRLENSREYRMALRTNSFSIKDGAVDSREPSGYASFDDPESVWFDPGQRQTVETGLNDLFGERNGKGGAK